MIESVAVISSHRLANHLKLVRAYLTGREPEGAIPTAAYIETTSRCNLACPMCARQLAGPEWIDSDITIEAFDDALGMLDERCELILPFAGGEPLLHPDLAPMVAHCTRSGRRTELATNATLLDGRRSRDLLLAGLSTLVISLDAATAETYDQIRRGGDFERTCANIHTFLRLKRTLGASTWVIIQMVALDENRGEAGALRRQWRSVGGVDVVRVKADDVHVERVRQGTGRRSDHRQRPCYFPWLGPLMVRHDGGVYPCCHFWRSAPVGRIGDQSAAEIWNGPAMAALRCAHLEGRADEYLACRECQAVSPHPALISASLLVPSHVTRRAIPYVEAFNRTLGRRLIRSSG